MSGTQFGNTSYFAGITQNAQRGADLAVALYTAQQSADAAAASASSASASADRAEAASGGGGGTAGVTSVAGLSGVVGATALQTALGLASGAYAPAFSGNYADLAGRPTIPVAYVLPQATSSLLGGVKVDGTTVTISGSGVISATPDATKAPLTSPGLSGVPTAPTASPGTNTLQIATTAFVTSAVAASGGSGSGYTLPTASTTTLGGVKIDGSTVTISNGVISAPYSYTLPTASASVLGGVKVDGSTVTISGGVISAPYTYTLPTATTSVLGGIKVDGTTITISSGVVSAASDASKAPLASPAFTGTPTVPTAAPGTSTPQAASTAFVGAAIQAAKGNGSATLSFGGGVVVTNGTYEFDVPYAATLTSLRYKVGSAGGSFSASVTNAGSAVGGLTNITVSSATEASAAATSGTSVAASTVVAIVISGVTGSPTDSRLVISWSRT